MTMISISLRDEVENYILSKYESEINQIMEISRKIIYKEEFTEEEKDILPKYFYKKLIKFTK